MKNYSLKFLDMAFNMRRKNFYGMQLKILKFPKELMEKA